MDDLRTRLAGCFALAFPKVDPDRLTEASVETVEGWDSLAQVTLLTLVGEEFAIDVDFEAFEGATSFAALEAKLAELGVGG